MSCANVRDLAYPALVKATILLLAVCVLCLPASGCKSSEDKAQDADMGETSTAPDAAQAASDGSDQVDAGCSGWTTLNRLSPAELSDLIATSNPIVINVHIPYEGDIPGTDTSIPYGDVDAIEAYLNHDHCAEVVLICLGGSMSQSAGNGLIKRGYLRVRDLNGGTKAWQAAGYPLLKDGGA
jgi:rhodanese-related sulfurtransferase